MKKHNLICSLGPLLLISVLSGCGASENQIAKAQEVCKPHGGIKILWGEGGNLDVDVLCKDGTTIGTKVKEPPEE